MCSWLPVPGTRGGSSGDGISLLPGTSVASPHRPRSFWQPRLHHHLTGTRRGPAVSLTPPRMWWSTWKCSSGLLPLSEAGLWCPWSFIRAITAAAWVKSSFVPGVGLLHSIMYQRLERHILVFHFYSTLVFEASLHFRIKGNAFTFTYFLNMVEYCWNMVLQYLFMQI